MGLAFPFFWPCNTLRSSTLVSMVTSWCTVADPSNCLVRAGSSCYGSTAISMQAIACQRLRKRDVRQHPGKAVRLGLWRSPLQPGANPSPAGKQFSRALLALVLQ